MANYDHPAYLARQVAQLTCSAGTSAASGYLSFPWQIKIHSMSVAVRTIGTATAGSIRLLSGTSTVANLVVGTSSVGSVVSTSTDINFTLPAGSPLSVEALADNSVAAGVNVEFNISPSATWVGIE